MSRADGEVFARTVDPAGGDDLQVGAHRRARAAGLTLDKVLKCDKTLTFGIGDAKSTSGTLAPMTYLFTPKGIDPAKCFKAVRSANHQANMLARWPTALLDVATNNTDGPDLLRTGAGSPAAFAKTEVIWTSPPLPESSIVCAQGPGPGDQGEDAPVLPDLRHGDRARRPTSSATISKGLDYRRLPGRPTTAYLDPVREMEAAEALAEAKRCGDAGQIAKAQAAFDKIRARPTPARATSRTPDDRRRRRSRRRRSAPLAQRAARPAGLGRRCSCC